MAEGFAIALFNVALAPIGFIVLLCHVFSRIPKRKNREQNDGLVGSTSEYKPPNSDPEKIPANTYTPEN